MRFAASRSPELTRKAFWTMSICEGWMIVLPTKPKFTSRVTSSSKDFWSLSSMISKTGAVRLKPLDFMTLISMEIV
ncbi:hypothetical protein D3C87_1960680 [compost metagenome]